MAPGSRLTALVALSVLACGGAPAAGPATPKADTSFGEAAIAQGGLSSLAPGGDVGHAAQLAATLKADLLADGDKVKLDGVLGEWPARTRAETFIQGSADPSFGFTMAVRYDATSLYVGGEVTTAAFHRTSRFADDEDHASLVLAFGTGAASVAAYEVGFFAGKPGETSGQVRFVAGGRGAVPGAQIVEAPMTGGYSFEAKVPWSAFPEARTVRVGLRGAGRYYEKGSHGPRVVATGPGDARHPEGLPPLPTDPEQSLDEGFLAERNLRGHAPTVDLLADVAGDSMKERVQVWGNTLTVCGPGYREGKGYFFRDLGAPVLRVEARALSGRGKDDLVVVRRVSEGDLTRDWFEVLSFLGKDDPVVTFGQEIAVARGGNHVDNTIHAVAGQIDVSILPAHGWDVSSYHEATASDVSPVLLPWGSVRAQTFRFDGARFASIHETAQTPAPGASVAVARIPDDPGARRASVRTALPASPDANALFDQYKRDHGLPAETTPRIDLGADLDADGRPERVVLVERDLVVSGPSLGGGHAYTFLTLEPFAAPADIREVTARDLAGHGAAQLLVRGTRHVQPAIGGDVVDEEVLLVYALRSGALVRVFAIETARSQGASRMQGLVQFVPARGGRGLDIDVRPGRATGWSKANYPWPQERPGGSIEPLLLPWGGTPSARYTWDGSKFAQAGARH